MIETARAVADRTAVCPVTIWGYGIGGTLSGLVRASAVLGEPAHADRVAELVEPALSAAPDPADHLIPVEALLALRDARPSAAVDAACSRWVSAVLGAPEAWPGGPRVHRPDLEPWSTTLWVDCMHTDGPGLAALGRPAEAVAYARAYAAVLQRDDGLFHHGYDVAARRGNGVAWGRGQAWALFGLVDTLHAVPDAELAARLDRLVTALASHEDGGRWHTVVDDPGSPVEHSVAAYVAWGLRRAVRHGLADASYTAVADRAFAATVGALDDGALVVSEATPVGDHQNYVRRATGVFPWGQAPVLHAVLDRIEEEQHR
nr:glycoside hydrolase family 88 protein [Jiangella mangrovi]